ncbi:lateral flagellin LafA [Paraferrimonas sp. SM1919]|uniref:lateral flagellin LafA n=1 Tax=Paraferrimonas sp. SM1919 TaxID=2662263 RepID=UPI0013D35EB5|nr:lateral flagellin LafA [Paraferrimonas sp. SM1919]
MALSVHTNYSALVAQNALNQNQNSLNTAMERLGTGLRINSAADDAAGLSIANKLEAQTRGMTVAMRNSQDAISMLQTADGALDELSNIAYRMKDLATQAANDSNGLSERVSLDAEYQELKAEAERIMEFTSYGAGDLLFRNGRLENPMEFQIGASSDEFIEVDMSGELTNIDFAGTLGTITGDTAANSGARAEIDAVTLLFDNINTLRGKTGATINRLEHTISNLGNIVENTSAAKGRIMDADFAVESSNMSKQQILMQAGTSVLAQAKQMTGLVTSLLR